MKGPALSTRTTTEVGKQPFLRWAGSKRWLAGRVAAAMVEDFGDYHEPFLGSGAVFFSIARTGRRHYLSDALEPLVNCYQQVSEQPLGVAREILSYGCTPDDYYELRAVADRGLSAKVRAARFIYFNRLGFNGLYRVNSSGGFNVPYGRPREPIVLRSEHELNPYSAALKQGVEVFTADFGEVTSRARQGDLVYLDPPYISGHRSNGFIDYNQRLFSWEDQRRLARVMQDLTDARVLVMMSNADHPAVRELYKGFQVLPLRRFSSMSASSARRGVSDELLIVNAAMRGAMKWPI